ncbi:MAG TPA: Rrf2 family transcriptional regulator [Thermoanaerobaculia bacterium]|jgi:Rrf2 family protein
MTTSSRFATAIHILTLLGHERDEPVTSELIAGSVNTNPVVIRRLLRALADAGLVTSVPGTSGGSRLARRPEDITLLDVYSAVEDEQLFGRHTQQPNPKCPVGSRIAELLTPRFDEATHALMQSLGSTTIASLLDDLNRAPARRRRQ